MWISCNLVHICVPVCKLVLSCVLPVIFYQVKSKFEILSSYADAAEGLITHGWITNIENHGCFVRFYNGVQGFAPRFVHFIWIFFG